MTDSLTRYESIKDTAWRAMVSGQLDESLNLLEDGIAWARASASSNIVDRLLCNRASVLIELGEAAAVTVELRKILMRNADDETRFLCGYTLARAFHVLGEGEKALQFAHMAQRHVHSLGPDQRSSCHNLTGVLLLHRSEFEQAITEFETALSLQPSKFTIRCAIFLDNLGYCHAIRNRPRKAFACLFESVRLSRRLRVPRVEATARLSLAYTYLQEGRAERARDHATRSLRLAEEQGDRTNLKYALFLLGEAQKQCGNPLLAHTHFHRLQREFYPESSAVPEMLLFLNVANLVNLKG